MSIITATFDTKEKTLSVTMDGAEVADLAEATFFRTYSEEKFGCCLTTVSEDEESDVRSYNRLTASENGLVSSLDNDVASFMGDRR